MTSFERRKDERVEYEGKTEYTLNLNDEVLLEGDIVNISANGLCLRTVVELREGEEITFQDSLPAGYQTATVVWIEKTDGDYLVGLKFQ